MKNCEYADTLTEENSKFSAMYDNMLADGRIGKSTHKRFTHIW